MCRQDESISEPKDGRLMNPCRKCGGLVIAEHEEFPCLRCVNCGDRVVELVPDPVMARRFGPSACVSCGAQPRLKRRTLCRGCMISEGFARSRGRG